MKTAGRERGSGRQRHLFSSSRTAAGQPAPAAILAQVKATRALVRALARARPGQPVTVTFAGGSSPPLAVHVAVGLPRRQAPEAQR